MKVIIKSNEFIAIPTKRKSDCLFQLGQYLNKETCKIEMDKEELKKITCVIPETKYNWCKTITLEAESFNHEDKYIILDKKVT